ncbi:MAG: hypothetical protein ACOYNN_14515 [Terrimicrobiaceae bacterium]
MAYTISNTDGTKLLSLGDGTIDQSATSLTLIGKNYTGFGQELNNNLVKLLANSANISPPRSPLSGQLWYDSTPGIERLKVYDGYFKPIGGAIISANQPELVFGDIWWDTANSQLKVYNGNTIDVVGPAFSKLIGENGFVLPANIVRDIDDIPKNITLIKNHGVTLGYVSSEPFAIKSELTSDYLTSGTTTSTVKGLTVLGDIQYTGKISNKYLTLDLNLSYITIRDDLYESNPIHVLTQNSRIAEVLRSVYPINTGIDPITNYYTTPTSTLRETGVPVYSEARVLCHSIATPNMYQIRLFKAGQTGIWEAKYTTSSYTATNMISEFTRI